MKLIDFTKFVGATKYYLELAKQESVQIYMLKGESIYEIAWSLDGVNLATAKLAKIAKSEIHGPCDRIKRQIMAHDVVEVYRYQEIEFYLVKVGDQMKLDFNQERYANSRVVCAAMKHRDGRVICSPRHFDTTVHRTLSDLAIKGENVKEWGKAIQGFVDQFGNFLTREEAFYVAMAKGQIIKRVPGDDRRLFSENLY